MLVLTRKYGESIIIQDDIVIAVVGINGTQVSLGIDAPKDISVHRMEIYRKIQEEQKYGNRERNDKEQIAHKNRLI